MVNTLTNTRKWLTKNISVSWLLILLFAYTAFSKAQLFTSKAIIDVSQFRDDMFKSPVLQNHVQVLGYLIPGIEFIICIMLLIKATKLVGYYLSLLLLCTFAGYIIFMMNVYPALPCTCGGIIEELSWHGHLLLNIFFILITTRAIVLTHKQKKQLQ